MKITKLHTLSQFVDLVQHSDGKEDYPTLAIFDYNSFLKQPLKKEMFVNKLSKPNMYDHWEVSLPYIRKEMSQDTNCLEWQESEKKVIFKKCKYFEDIETINIEFTDEYQLSYWKEDATLYAIAIETDGNLKLQNVVI